MSEGISPATKGFLIALVYGLTSASMAFVNKAVLSTYNYDYPVFLVTVQMLFTVVLLESLNIFNVVTLVPFTLERGKAFFFPSLFYAINSVLGLSALSGMNIPMYGMLKRMGPLSTLILGTVLLGKGRPQPLVCLSVAMITIGCITAGYGDLAFDLQAYLIGLVSVLSQSIYQVLVQKRAQTMSASETLHLNSYNTLPLLLFFCVITGEMKESLIHFHSLNIGFVVVFTVVITTGCVLNYMLFLCITFNSALTTSITGTLKSIVQTFIGMFTFGGISLNVFTISGIIINLMGGVMYSFIKYLDGREKSLAKSKSAINPLDRMDESNTHHDRGEKVLMNGIHHKQTQDSTQSKVMHRISISEDDHEG